MKRSKALMKKVSFGLFRTETQIHQCSRRVDIYLPIVLPGKLCMEHLNIDEFSSSCFILKNPCIYVFYTSNYS